MLKGAMEGCVLAILRQKECYGYEISRNLERYGFGRAPEGTIYPILLGLEKRSSISSVSAPYRRGSSENITL